MRSSQLKRGRPKKRPWISEATAVEVYNRTNGLCCCGCGRPIAHGPIGFHHVLPRSRYPELADVPGCIVGVSEICHASHENGSNRLSRTAIICAEDQVLGAPSMEAYLDRTYGDA